MARTLIAAAIWWIFSACSGAISVRRTSPIRGDLNESEYLSIETYRNKLIEKITDANHAVADGS